MRARENRLRHLLTIWRGVSRREAMTSLDNPSSARRMILARITSQYGDVYFLAIDSSVCRSSLERFTLNWLFLGIRDTIPLMQSLSDYVTNSTLKYVIVFMNSCTKLV